MKTGSKVALFLLGLVIVFGNFYEIYRRNNPKPPAEPQITHINEVVSDENDVDFKVTSIYDTNTVGEGMFAVTTENNFIVLTVNITNNGREAYDVNPLRFMLMDGKTEYEYCTDTIFTLKNQMMLDDINPGLSKEYSIIYETPYKSDEKDWMLKVKANATHNRDSIFIKLKER